MTNKRFLCLFSCLVFGICCCCSSGFAVSHHSPLLKAMKGLLLSGERKSDVSWTPLIIFPLPVSVVKSRNFVKIWKVIKRSVFYSEDTCVCRSVTVCEIQSSVVMQGKQAADGFLCSFSPCPLLLFSSSRVSSVAAVCVQTSRGQCRVHLRGSGCSRASPHLVEEWQDPYARTQCQADQQQQVGYSRSAHLLCL